MLVKTAHARFSLRGHRGAGEARTSYLSIASPRRGPLLAAALLGQILDPGEGLDALRKPERRNGEQGDLLQLLGRQSFLECSARVGMDGSSDSAPTASASFTMRAVRPSIGPASEHALPRAA